jgi:hypothetical protein
MRHAHRQPSLLQEIVQFVAFLVLAAITVAVLSLDGIDFHWG